MSAFKAGQSVFVVRPGRTGFNESARTGHATITKIGRRWAELSTGDRFDIATLRLDGSDFGYGPGFVCADAETWERRLRLASAWREFSQRVLDSMKVPDNVGEVEIAAAASALGWTLESLQAADSPGDTGADGS